MSFIVTVHTNEGIIMASDSRTTYTTTLKGTDGTITKQIGVQLTDNTYKTFLCPNNVGISTCGDSSINGVPIAGFIEKYIIEKVNQNTSVQEVAEGLISWFSAITSSLITNFIVAGYNNMQIEVYRVYTGTKNVIRQDTTLPGVMWDGETDIFKRLIKDVALNDGNNSFTPLPFYSTGYEYFTLQDAIDYAEYAVDVTIKTMFFQDRVKTVGGPIDILAIKPDSAFWIKRKELHA